MIKASNGFLGSDSAVVEFDGSAVTIKRGLFGNRVITIPVSRMTQVGWRVPVLAGHGRIEFIAAGADGLVKFKMIKKGKFEALRAAVEEAMSA